MKKALYLSMGALALMADNTMGQEPSCRRVVDKKSEPVRYDGELKDYKNKKCKSCSNCYPDGRGQCSYPNHNACSNHQKRKKCKK